MEVKMSNRNLRRKNMGNKKKGLIGLAVMCVFSGVVILSSNAVTDWMDKKSQAEIENNINIKEGLKDGVYKAEEAEFSDGYKGIVEMTVKNGAITELIWDMVDEEGNTKGQLSLEGKYLMTEDGPIWKEQSEALAKYVIEHQSIEGLTTNEEGKTDVVSGVSISINGFINLVEECLKQAKGEVQVKGNLTDGVYKAEEAEFSNGYKGVMEMTIKNGAITELIWDAVDEEGSNKSQLSLNGEYLMTEDGPIWKEQSEALAKYMIEHQSIEGLTVNEEGKTDVVSGVSISINGFINLVEECLKQAKGETQTKGNLIDGVYKAEAAEFSNGYKGVMEMTIKNGAITELIWDDVDEEGNKKSQLSLNGEYLMTEDGPIWKEQSEALAKYVIEHQSIEGLTVNEEGKTDVVSGVSIGINGFINLVEECLKQANSQKEIETEAKSRLRDGEYIAEESEYDKTGYKGIVKMIIKDGTITGLTWDCTDKEGNTKSQLSLDGEYLMTEDGPIWKEQSEALTKYVIEHQSIEGLTVNEEGKTDVVSGVSINISGFLDLVENCFSSATMKYKNGTYKAEEKDFDSAGYKGIMEMTIRNGNITELTWDCLDKEGNKKSQLSLDGEYLMTEDGPIWKEQSEALAEYVISHQSLEGLEVDEEGKTDVISSVSININGFLELVEDCLKQAQ